MDHLLKQSSIQELVKYNKRLLLIALLLSFSCVLSTIKVFSKEERWLSIPAIEPDRRMIHHNTSIDKRKV
ncbi:putative conjugative transfer protein TraE [Rickettsia amblyommatis str. Darkwater]|uniref:Putative conjugative transfer protein TraE n=1 Tax=Rickettsia amblyommatis str. Ac/Pa TaxID=1359164 RepID=A0A0F3N2E9_RICAM|nr:putative conjugative transfer protein TraE [Rickettsia amblyommatis str. Ac/Pa]KJW00003.1 putative conjugative transfer protein TraE [Rickettsia amblyommatis str. Darkwater]